MQVRSTIYGKAQVWSTQIQFRLVVSCSIVSPVMGVSLKVATVRFKYFESPESISHLASVAQLSKCADPAL
jgi:hypothetical protein